MKVLLCDDHPAITEGMKELFSRHQWITLICEAKTVGEALALIKKHSFDIAIVDLALDQADGLDLIRKFGMLSPTTRAIVYTSYDCKLKGLEAIQAGACGYFTKDYSAKLFPEIIQQVMEGNYCFSQKMINFMAQTLRETEVSDPNLNLNQEEVRLLNYMTEQLSTTEITAKFNTSESNIYKKQGKIMKKLGITKKTDLVPYWQSKKAMYK